MTEYANELTNYDLFMLKKREAEEKLFGKTSVAKVQYEEKNEVNKPMKVEERRNPLFEKEEEASFFATKRQQKVEKKPEIQVSEPIAEEKLQRNYKEYLKAELCRTTPERILSEEEYYASQKTQYADKKVAISKPKPAVEYNEDVIRGNKPSVLDRILKRVSKNAEFRKGGKLFIAIYVIIVVAVAFTLLVTTSINSNETVVSADAANAKVVEQTEAVKPLIYDDVEESGNWFDKLCDSLNK